VLIAKPTIGYLGWDGFKTKQKLIHPLYWSKGRWAIVEYTLQRFVTVRHENKPLVQLVIYEADAFCQWERTEGLPDRAELEIYLSHRHRTSQQSKNRIPITL